MAVTLAVDNTQQSNILDRAVLLSLSIHRFGVSKKVQSSEVKTDANPEMIRVTKRILDCKEYDEITKADSAFSALIASLALPSMFRAGVYAVPLTLVERVDAIIQLHLSERESLVDGFLDHYQSAVAEAELQLGSLYDAANYPSVERVRGAYYVDYKYFSTSVPEKLRHIRADIWNRESERAKLEVESMRENMQALLRQAMRNLLAHLADKLTPKPDGSAKIFRNSAVENVTAFLATFPDRNLAQDGEMDEITRQVGQLLEGVTPENLRSDADLRDQVRETFAVITQTLDGMLTDRGARKFSFDED